MNMPVERMTELSSLIAARLEDVSFSKSQREVADEAGFANRNMLSLIKSGQTKLSLDRVPAMAKALGLDLHVVMVLALKQYYSDETVNLIRQTFDGTETQTEHEILAIARKNMNTKEGLSYETRQELADLFKNNKPAGA